MAGEYERKIWRGEINPLEPNPAPDSTKLSAEALNDWERRIEEAILAVVSSGRELGYKEMTANQSGITAETVIADLAPFSFTLGQRPVYVHVSLGTVANSTAGNRSALRLRDITGLSSPTASQGTVKRVNAVLSSVANVGGGLDVWVRYAPEPGVVKTVRPTVAPQNTGTSTVYADDGSVGFGPSFIRAIEA